MLPAPAHTTNNAAQHLQARGSLNSDVVQSTLMIHYKTRQRLDVNSHIAKHTVI